MPSGAARPAAGRAADPDAADAPHEQATRQGAGGCAPVPIYFGASVRLHFNFVCMKLAVTSVENPLSFLFDHLLFSDVADP